MSRCPIFVFQLSIKSEWLANLISTKVSFKIIIRKIHVYIDIGWPWICVHETGYINRKRSFPNCIFVLMISLKWTLHIYFTFLQEFYLTHIRNSLIFFRIIVDVMSNIHFSSLDYSKWLAKHISTKVSFKFTIRKRHVYIDISWPWIWNQYFYLEFEMMIVLK